MFGTYPGYLVSIICAQLYIRALTSTQFIRGWYCSMYRIFYPRLIVCSLTGLNLERAYFFLWQLSFQIGIPWCTHGTSSQCTEHPLVYCTDIMQNVDAFLKHHFRFSIQVPNVFKIKGLPTVLFLTNQTLTLPEGLSRYQCYMADKVSVGQQKFAPPKLNESIFCHKVLNFT